MYEVKIYKAEEIREFDFSVAGEDLSAAECKELKIYADGTAYINKKKVSLSESDIATIENAKEIYFLYSASNAGGAYFDADLKEFSTSEFGHGAFVPSDTESFKAILANNNINILN